jgi:hypothetical protein
MSKGLFALLLAGTFMVPSIAPAFGNDATVGLRVQEPPSQAQSWGTLPLAPVPYLETTPWLTSDFLLKGPKVDILLGSKVETLGPFLVAPSIPPRQFSFNGGMTE